MGRFSNHDVHLGGDSIEDPENPRDTSLIWLGNTFESSQKRDVWASLLKLLPCDLTSEQVAQVHDEWSYGVYWPGKISGILSVRLDSPAKNKTVPVPIQLTDRSIVVEILYLMLKKKTVYTVIIYTSVTVL